MRKRAVVLAIGAALAVQGVYAQKGGGGKGDGPEPDTVVILYGKVYPEVIWVSSSGATASGTTTCSICGAAAGSNAIIKRSEMESSNSRFGIRGHERLGGSLKAIWQLETQFSVSDNGTAFATRDSYVGLSSGWGTIKLGRMDTPFKEYGDDVSFLGVSSGNFTSTAGVYRHIGFGTQNNAARFHERRSNAVQYESPNLGPIDFKLQADTDENKAATGRNPRTYSAGLKWGIGPIALMFGYEIHKDLFGLSANVPSALRNNAATSGLHSEDKAMAVAVQWKIGGHTFELDANRKKYDEPNSIAGHVRAYQNNGYLFGWDARWGASPWRTAFHFVKGTAGKCEIVARECNTSGLDGTQTSVGLAYNFSRRFYAFVMGSLVKNGTSSVYNNSNLQGPNPGEDIRQVAFGLHTTF